MSSNLNEMFKDVYKDISDEMAKEYAKRILGDFTVEKFKPGDKVRQLRDEFFTNTGWTGIILEFNLELRSYIVKFDKYHKTPMIVNADNLELVVDKPKKTVVQYKTDWGNW
jgi:hypothetical protein